MNFDEYIVEAVRGHTAERPQDLVGILYNIDGRMKLLPLNDELRGGLARLVESGRIIETERHRFAEGDGKTGQTFSGITDEEWRRADDAYRRWFWAMHRASRDAE